MIISTSKYVKTNGDNPILPPLQMMPEAGVVTEQGGWGIQGPEEVWPHQRATPGFPLPCLPLPAGPVTEIPGPMESRPRREARAVTWERLGGKDEGGCLLPFPRYSVHTAGWRLACSLLPSTRWGASVRQWRCLVHYGDPSIQPSTWHTVSTLISDSVQGGPREPPPLLQRNNWRSQAWDSYSGIHLFTHQKSINCLLCGMCKWWPDWESVLTFPPVVSFKEHLKCLVSDAYKHLLKCSFMGG